MEYPRLNVSELRKAKKEDQHWKRKAIYWHSAIPNFDHGVRGSLTKDVNLITNLEGLELNKKLFTGIHWNNWINVSVSILNLVLLIFNIANL